MMRHLPAAVACAVSLFISLFVLPTVGLGFLGRSIIVPTLLLILLLGDVVVASWGAVACGFIVDLVTLTPFGSTVVPLLTAIAVTAWLARSRMTTRSAIALLTLVALGTAIVHLGTAGIAAVVQLVDVNALRPQFDAAWLMSGLYDIIRAVLLASIGYAVVRSTGRSYATLTARSF